MNLPYLTPNLPGVGGTLKTRPEDFFVQEIPLYEPIGTGEHVYCEIQKVGIPTFEAVHRIAHALNVSSRDIGYAGLKDAQAITRQTLSIQGTTEADVMALKLPDITILWAARHQNKLRLGHLKGNRFAIKIRDVTPTDVLKLQPIIQILEKRGLPNYFGEQRFGRRGDNDLLGAALLRADYPTLLHHLLGSPNPAIDDPKTRSARAAFDRGEFDVAMRQLPRNHGMERRILARLIKTTKPAAAVRAIDEKLRRLWVSALQSRLFNDVVAHRIDTIDHLLDGDLAYKHENGACFRVEDPATEQPRCDAFEISPTGPLIGYRMTLPAGRALEIEEQAFAAASLTPQALRGSERDRAKGARRPLRIRPEDFSLAAGVDDQGPHITTAFTLPAGSFATVLLRELMKTDSTLTPIPTP